MEKSWSQWLLRLKAFKNFRLYDKVHRQHSTFRQSIGLIIQQSSSIRYPHCFYSHKTAGILMGRNSTCVKPYYFYQISHHSCPDTYIGHTYHLPGRILTHFIDSTDNLYQNRKIYKTINQNGGFNDWNIKLIKTSLCSSRRDAESIEQQLIDFFHPTLNSISAKRKLLDPNSVIYL